MSACDNELFKSLVAMGKTTKGKTNKGKTTKGKNSADNELFNELVDMQNRSIKKECARQVGLKNFANDVAIHNETACVDAWKVLYHQGLTELLETMIWDFITNSPKKYWVKCQSELLDIYTKIGDYTNKKGVTTLAHYSVNEEYVGSVFQLGEKPTSYYGNFQVTREKFVIDLSQLPKLNTLNGEYKIAMLFKPKQKIIQKSTPKFIIESDDEN